jgi:hypothetical protein
MPHPADVHLRFVAELDEVRRRLADAERPMLELMVHKTLLQRLGRADGPRASRDELEKRIAELRVEEAFAEQRVMFTKPRAAKALIEAPRGRA